jgi:hypothetical protein
VAASRFFTDSPGGYQHGANSFFECFPYVCPEPGLEKWCILDINGAKVEVAYHQFTYQDRLGTNAGKQHSKRDAFFL